MAKRRKLPDAFEKNSRSKQSTIEFIPLKKSANAVLNKSTGAQQAQVLTMESVRIDFPLKPYPAQLQMMSKIIHALNNSENALLESPTGSGKSLALLCAALAWKENEQKKNRKPANETSRSDFLKNEMEVPPEDWAQKFKYEEPTALNENFAGTEGNQLPLENECLQPTHSNTQNATEVCTRIFVGSRTHRQLSQLISELKRNTKYTPRITVLGSREQLCNHPVVSKSSNKSEDCITLLDKGECSYFHNTKKIVSNSSLKTTNRVWDIEDMISLGKQVKGCAYYASRKLYESAEVVFCPYNYILDPVIRKLLDINLKGSIVILDEAHNMEDAARSAGSFAIDDKTLGIVKIELASIIKGGFEVEAHTVIESLFDSLWDFITSEKNTFTILERDRHAAVWAGPEIIQQIKNLGVESDSFEEYFVSAYRTVSAHADMIRKEKERRSSDIPDNANSDSQVKIHRRECLSNNSLSVVQTIFMVFGFLFRKDRNYANDYRMVLMSAIVSDNESTQKRRPNIDSDWNFKLEFWCMNPGVIFQDMSASTKSVILTSGTLSPMDTFASELETTFPGKLEANHVIDSTQAWVSCIPVGPNGTNLKGVYAVVEGMPYQDDIGEALYTISTKVPFGVLCFLPSYKLLNTLMARWKKTGLLERLKKLKTIFQEPKGSDKKKFEREIVRYYSTINDAAEYPNAKKNGAIFFAVYRGKVSEGIDFPNNYCRAVVALGIPFPGVKDMEVKLKRQYNDIKKDRMKENVLSGENWYSVQAYRAINQALGRCIRHKNDWGAIILLESRFTEFEKRKGLSKWLRDRVEVQSDFEKAMTELEEFVQTRIRIDKETTEKEKSDQAKLAAETMKKEKDAYNASNAYLPLPEHQQLPEGYTVNRSSSHHFPYLANTTMAQQAFVPYSQFKGSLYNPPYMGNVPLPPSQMRGQPHSMSFPPFQGYPYYYPFMGIPMPPQAMAPLTNTQAQYYPIPPPPPIAEQSNHDLTLSPSKNEQMSHDPIPLSPTTEYEIREYNPTQEHVDFSLDKLLKTSVESIIENTMTSMAESKENLGRCDSIYRKTKAERAYSNLCCSQPKVKSSTDPYLPVTSPHVETEPAPPASAGIVESPYFTKPPAKKEDESSAPIETKESKLNSQQPNPDSFSIAGVPSDPVQSTEDDLVRTESAGPFLEGEASFENLDAVFEDDLDFSVSDVCIEESQTVANISPRDFQPGIVEKIYCDQCQTVLMTGDRAHLVLSSQPAWDCGASQGPMWEVQCPERWISLLCIDPAKLPNEAQVYMNKKDRLFYQKMHCGCDQWVGVFICGAMETEQDAQIGKVFLWHRAVLTSEARELKTQTMMDESENEGEDFWDDLLTSEVDALAKTV